MSSMKRQPLQHQYLQDGSEAGRSRPRLIERHALVAMEGPAGAQLADEFFSLRRIGLLRRSGPEGAVVAGLAKRSARIRAVPDQGRVDWLPGRPAICANRDLAAVELDAVIGMDVHLGALAGRVAIGGARDCLATLAARRAAVRRASNFEVHRQALGLPP